MNEKLSTFKRPQIRLCRSIYLVRNNELIEKKADTMPIGIYIRQEQPFSSNHFDYLQGDTIYMSSDSYADQLGGNDGSKFKTKNFKKLLTNISNQPLEEQAQILRKTHLEWRGKTTADR